MCEERGLMCEMVWIGRGGMRWDGLLVWDVGSRTFGDGGISVLLDGAGCRMGDGSLRACSTGGADLAPTLGGKRVMAREAVNLHVRYT